VRDFGYTNTLDSVGTVSAITEACSEAVTRLQPRIGKPKKGL